MDPLMMSLHAEQRIRGRGIRHADVALVVSHGEPVRDGYVLRRCDAERAISDLKHTIARIERLAGIFVAVKGRTVLSVYRPDKFRRRKLREVV